MPLMTKNPASATQQEIAADSLSPDFFDGLLADRLALYEQRIASLRESEVRLREELTTIALPADLQDALAKTTLQPATRHLGLPLTEEEAEAFNREHDEKSIPAYVLTNRDTAGVALVNETAKKLVPNAPGPAGPKKLPIDAHNHLVAIAHFPKQAGGRLPQKDFKAQQHLLTLLVRNGLYDNPGTEPILSTNSATGPLPPYYKVKVHSRHAFSPHTGEYVWTVCTLSGTKIGEALDQQTYDNAYNGGKLVYPLPEDINDMVQERSAIVTQALAWIDERKLLPQGYELARLLEGEQHENRSLPYSLDTLSAEKIESLSLRDLKRALPHTKNFEKVRLAEQYCEEITSMTQKLILAELKRQHPDMKPVGKVSLYPSFNQYEAEDGTHVHVYMKAGFIDENIGKTSRSLGRLEGREKQEAIEKHQAKQLRLQTKANPTKSR
jgi:hypothetical protein